MNKTILALILVHTLMTTGVQADLTGRWSCDDGGTYYLRQAGDQLYWFGEAAGNHPAWANVFTGKVSGSRVEGAWLDVPKGRAAGSGRLELVVEADGDRLRAVQRTGGFAGSRWKRSAVAATVRSTTRLEPVGKDGCASFDLKSVDVQQENGRWKVVAGRHWLFDFGEASAAAHRALTVIRHYRLDRICRVGGPDPAMTYLLAKGGVPSGAMAGEDCMAFDPRQATVSKVKGRWKIVSGNRWILDFGGSRDDASKALAVIRRHGFSRICYVGRPDADMTYFRQ